MDIWAECKDRVSLEPIANELIRIVESQEQVATNDLVDSLEEQAALEQMLESTKPALPHSHCTLDYLLDTPFRYPPLRFGSRFGTRQEPSLFYGSLSSITAFAETGYYRFLFWLGMSVPPPSGKLVTQHTVFAVNYTTKNGFKLQDPPFNVYENYLINPSDYTATQKLGGDMRNAGVEAFVYRSSRDPNHGLNAALFNVSALASTRPLYKEQWLCETNQKAVTFFSAASKDSVHVFPINTYLVDGVFPHPAT